MRIFPFLLALSLTACGQPAASGPAVALPAPLLAEDAVPKCAEGAELKLSLTDVGYERWCEAGGKMVGPYERWTRDGQLLIAGSWKNDKPDGDWKWNWPNGKRRAQVRFQSGKRVLNWMAWHDNGQQAEQGEYLDGRLVGSWKAWSPGGTMALTGSYANGKRDGTWVEFDGAGAELSRTQWQGGAQIQ